MGLRMNVRPTCAGCVHATTFTLIAAAWRDTPVLPPMDRIHIVAAVTTTPFCLYFPQLYDSSVSQASHYVNIVWPWKFPCLKCNNYAEDGGELRKSRRQT